MARRQQTSGLDDLITLASKLPWKVSLFLAFLSFIILHAIASRPAVKITGPGQMSDAVTHGMFVTMAMFGQLIVPFAFIVGAIVSGMNSARQRKLYEGVQSRSDLNALHDMSWEQFEELIGEHFRRTGFTVSREGGNGPDGGIDLVLRRGREKHLVQCKQWKAYKVGVQPVREFYGVMAASGAAGGYLVTSGEFSQDAERFVCGLNLELIDGKKLKSMIGSAAKTGQPTTAPARRAEPIPHVPRPEASSIVAPACPKCGAEMARRTARKGINSGNDFWGCSAYPKCNGTSPLEDQVISGAEPVAPAAEVTIPEKRTCPHCGTELVLKSLKSGPKEGQEFYACMPCRQAWPVQA